MSNKIDRTGEISVNTKGQKMKIIDYCNANDVDIQFDDGNIVSHKRYSHFVRGNIENPVDKELRKSRLGEVRFNNQGQRMVVTKYHSSQQIEVTFDNGAIVKTSYSIFLRGIISNQEKYYTKEENELILDLFLTNIDELIKKTGRSYISLKTRYYGLNPIVKELHHYGLLRNEYPNLYDELVDKINFLNITSGSSKNVEWQSECGHIWISSPVKRINGMNCPYCSHKKLLTGFNDLMTLNPKLAQEWHPTKNDIQPTEVFPNCNEKVWWKCSKGHEWKATIINRNRKHYGCPMCTKIEKESIGERLIKEFLEDNNIPYKREVPIKDDISTLFLDYLTSYGAIEFDGEQHFHPVTWFGGKQGLKNTENRDKRKNEYCKIHNIPLLRIRYDEIEQIPYLVSNLMKGTV